MSRNRVANARLTPYAYVCLIEMYRLGRDNQPVTFVNRSTGFLIAPNVIVTAGHSLQEEETKIYKLKIYPHQNSETKSEQMLLLESDDFVIRKVPEYNNPYCYVKDDFGIIFLKKPELPAWTHQHFTWRRADYERWDLAAGQPIQIAGYPIDRPDFEMWEERGDIVEVTKKCILHPFTTTKRNSGSPVWTIDPRGGYRVVGIHVSGNAASCGAAPENRPYGSAVLITERVFDKISSWIEEESADLNADSVLNAVSVGSGGEVDRRKFMHKAALGLLGTSVSFSAPERKKEWLVHHVLFYLKDPDNAQHEAQLIAGLEKLSKLPTVRQSHIGRPARTNGGDIEKGYSVSWLCFFKNLIEEEIYQTDPVHLAFLAEIEPILEKRVVYDALGLK